MLKIFIKMKAFMLIYFLTKKSMTAFKPIEKFKSKIIKELNKLQRLIKTK